MLKRTHSQAPTGDCVCENTGRSAPERLLRALPFSQAGSRGLGRHQCAICAVHEGYEAAPSRQAGDTHEYSGFGDESKNFQRRARQALPLLVAQAKARNTITYGQLALEMNMPNPRNLNKVLGAVGTELKNLSVVWKEKIPPLNCLVINKHHGTPQQGIAFFMPVKEFLKLSRSRQREILHDLNWRIWNYPKWDQVMEHFKVEAVVPAKTKSLQTMASDIKSGKYGRGGGETEDHRRLKEYIKENPQRVGLRKVDKGITEYRFLSNDEIDVLFKSAPTWIGIEVKGVRSDAADILRGVFQCVKYQALLEAAQRFYQLEVDTRVILVLGGSLPKDIRRVVGLLNIELVQNVEVPLNFQC